MGSYEKVASAVKSMSVQGSHFRQSEYDTPVRVETNASGGRYNHPRSRPTQYFSGSIPTVWREVLRRDNVRSSEDAAEYESQVYEVEVDCQNIANLSTFAVAESVGLDPAVLVDDDHNECRDLADALVAKEFRGLMAPSAASQVTGDVTLVLFGAYVDIEWEETTGLANVIRARPVMRKACPPDGLVETVRFRGDTHRPLAEFIGRK